MTSFHYVSVASVLHNEEQKKLLMDSYRCTLQEYGGEELPPEAASAVPDLPVFIFVLTGGTEAQALSIVRQLRMVEQGMPVVLLAHPKHNSLPASLEILARVRQTGGSGVILQMDETGRFLDEASAAHVMKVASAIMALQHTRIGVVGKPSDWLVASSQGAAEAKARWGVELVDIPLDRLLQDVGRMRTQGYKAPVAGGMLTKASFFREAAMRDVEKSMEILEALRHIVTEYRLDALTLRCFDLVLQDRSTGCLALSALSDEGIDAGCEGDVPSILALRWLRLLTGEIGWMANPSRIVQNDETGTFEMLLAHCTAPRTILQGYGLRSHFESGLGVAVAGVLAPGPVTLVRIGGTELDRLWFCAAAVIDSPHYEGLCRTQAVVRIQDKDAEALLSDPLGNHLVMIRGDHSQAIALFARMKGLRQ
ncbi:MAG: hypothetical protein WHT81_00035 [Rectinemataceae bacterium]|nr:hypothetical protein [Spirochaetaceae bacterium]